MYYEDSFHPNEENAIASSNQKKELNNVKSFDSGYGYVYRNKSSVSSKVKNARVDCYTSGDLGVRIRNAETGQYYKYKVGSKDEDLFFKIALASGELKTTNGSNVLFYDSPEQYEKHLMAEIDQEIKERWVNKKKLQMSKNSEPLQR
jgi:hypothetical protein